MGHAVKLIYTVEDYKGKQATCVVHLPADLTIIDYVEFAEEMGDLIDALITGSIVNVGIAFTVDFAGFGWDSTPSAVADVEEKGYFQFRTDGAFFTGIKLPTWSDFAVLAGSDLIDQADSDVAAFVTAMEDGITLPIATTLVTPTDSREDEVDGLVFAREVFRASGKRA